MLLLSRKNTMPEIGVSVLDECLDKSAETSYYINL